MSRVLVVDDERDVRQAFARALRLAGLLPAQAGSADEALQKCEEETFDVVILDFIMPDMNGIELLTRIRRLQPFVRSIVVSGKLDRRRSESDISKDLREAVEADVYLHKPVDNDTLLEAVRGLTTAEADRDWKDVASGITSASRTNLTAARRAAKELKKHRSRRTPQDG
ncbi:MAG: response regulator [Thermoanaerobaculia bacterium]